ncbi:MAG: sterol desaturase family protein [Alphaproteobacteria bacterium]|nr:sterol desaturase family protein [Alphaproteobacteria bacterium]
MNNEFITRVFHLYLGKIVQYCIIAGIPFLMFYVIFKTKFLKYKVQTKHIPKTKDILRELYYSNQSFIVSLIITTPLVYTSVVNYTKYTFSFTELKGLSMWWCPALIILLLILHDSYFYWLHWLFHKPRLFKFFHVVHHKSHNPTPFASLSFNFSEVFCLTLFNAFVLFLIPMNRTVLIVFGVLAFSFNVYGHSGYEIMPSWFRKTFLFKICVTSVHHNLHHSKTHYNFGLYFRFWDRIMKTEYPHYEAEFDKVLAMRRKE